MFDVYTKNKLELWANWYLRKLDNGGGYPKKSAFVTTPGGGFWTPEMDSQCYEVDKAICSLINERKDVLMAYYTKTGTNEQKAKTCGCSLRTFYTRVDMAQHDIFSYLNG
jgi:hypothetical protein